ncbi:MULTISPECIES: hypothetical protein [unclassified Streptomyces]|uniref:hypothetical protein n=1 Tax=unclassified Streptomyces TaxID=2593676 RepID=UPI001CD7CD0F|nr:MULTISPECIES: hypothetical protein [unclassified Streptomyces]
MTTLETSAVRPAGKSTRGSRRLSAGEATRSLTLPQLPYADAVHTELTVTLMTPGAFEAGIRLGRNGTSELFMRAVWPVGTATLSTDVRPAGLTLAWSHVTGWSAQTADEDRVILPVDTLADPGLIANAAAHFARHGLTRQWLPPHDARWSEAVYLDIALVRFDEREGLL